MTNFREQDTVILCEFGQVEEGTPRLAVITSISDGVACVDGKRFPMNSAEPWNIPEDGGPQRRYSIKSDTPDNRLFHGLGAAPKYDRSPSR